MRYLDAVIFFSCIAASAIIGVLASKRSNKNSDFHLAGSRMGWFPVAASLTATVFSAINFTGFSTEIVRHGFYTVIAIPMLLLAAWPISVFFIPFFMRRRGVSIYGFLEQRYSTRVRRSTGALFILWRLAWLAVALHATAVFLSGITNVKYLPIVLLCAVVTTAYTALGGMRSVMLTDIFQCIILLISLVVIAVSLLPMFTPAHLSEAVKNGIFKPFVPLNMEIFNPSPSIRISFWSCLIGATIAFIARYGADQMLGQRYLSARDSSSAIRGFWANIIMYLAALSCLTVIGLAMRISAGNSAGLPEGIIIRNFLLNMPHGFAGLLAGGLLLATMSSIDSGLHSCATSFSVDLLGENADTRKNLFLSRIAVVVSGVLITLGALHAHKLGSIFEIANRIINGLGSPLLAVVLLGMTPSSTTPRGMMFGIIAGTALSGWSSAFNSALSLHHHATVNLLITLLACYAGSFFDVLTGRKPV